MNVQALLKQAQKMQADMSKAENELKSKSYEANAQDGLVKVTVNGEYQITNIEISDKIKDDKDMIQDLVMIAANQAIQAAVSERDNVMGELTGGVKMPGIF